MYGAPGDSDVCVRRPHSRDMEHVRESFRTLFLFLPDQLNLAGGDGMARLVVVHILSEQLKYKKSFIHLMRLEMPIQCQETNYNELDSQP